MIINVNQSPDAHYTVYKLTAPNGKMYIGCTARNVKIRWRKKSYPGKDFKHDIELYGWENIKKEIICEKLLADAAYELEKKMVEYYDTMNPDIGYNRKTGGRNAGSTYSAKQTIIFSLAHRKHQENPEVRISKNERLRKYYSIEENKKPQRSSKKPRPIKCITTGEVFPSIRKAALAHNLHRHAISNSCKKPGSFCCGLEWEFVS